MATAEREQVAKMLEDYKEILKPANKGIRVLEIGIDGDPHAGANRHKFGEGNIYETLDFLPRLNPTYVADIQDAKIVPSVYFDIVICTQTLEHVYNPKKAVKEIFRILKPGGYAIIDSPWSYEWHPTHDYDDYWRISPSAMKQVLKEAGFEIIECKLSEKSLITRSLSRRPV